MLRGILFIFLIVSIGFNAFAQELDYSLARIGKKVQGVYIFINAEPAQPYDFVATIKVNDFWEERTPQEAYERLITKSKNKYPNFNGVIFHNDDFHTADLIKFKGLEIGGGGFHVGDKVAYLDNGDKALYGEIIAINTPKEEATFRYFSQFNAEKNETVRYTKLQLLTEEEYAKALKIAEQSKKIFSKDQRVSWSESGSMKYGMIQEVNVQTEKAVVKYMFNNGQEKTKTKGLKDIFPATDTEYQNYNERIQLEVKKHTFNKGDKVKWVKDSGAIIHAVIVSFNSTTMNATIKYLNDKNSERILNVDAFYLFLDEN